mmetsp:Transcript_60779/g.131826  ORF Transcript_60779/g.131826 Transcript_60779/m.131826 type:complete len:236 (-) Transcript_60779:989-1696(-)
MDVRSLAAEVKGHAHLLTLVGLLAKSRMALAKIPDVEPCRRNAALPLHLHALPGVVQAFLRLVQRRVAPGKISVKNIVELPALLGGEGDHLLDLLQGNEGIVGTELLHPHGTELVQRLHKPGAPSLAAQWDKALDDSAGLVDLVVLEVDAYEIQGHAQVPRLGERGRELALGQSPRKLRGLGAMGQGPSEKPVPWDVRRYGRLRLSCLYVSVSLGPLLFLLRLLFGPLACLCGSH